MTNEEYIRKAQAECDAAQRESEMIRAQSQAICDTASALSQLYGAFVGNMVLSAFYWALNPRKP